MFVCAFQPRKCIWLVSPKSFFLLQAQQMWFFFSLSLFLSECKLLSLISIFRSQSLDSCALEEKYIFIFFPRALFLLSYLIKET